MNAVTLKAHYDGRQVCLDEPCELPPATKLLVLVVPDSADTFQEGWFALSRQRLARAYGDEKRIIANTSGDAARVEPR